MEAEALVFRVAPLAGFVWAVRKPRGKIYNCSLGAAFRGDIQKRSMAIARFRWAVVHTKCLAMGE